MHDTVDGLKSYVRLSPSAGDAARSAGDADRSAAIGSEKDFRRAFAKIHPDILTPFLRPFSYFRARLLFRAYPRIAIEGGGSLVTRSTMSGSMTAETRTSDSTKKPHHRVQVWAIPAIACHEVVGVFNGLEITCRIVNVNFQGITDCLLLETQIEAEMTLTEAFRSIGNLLTRLSFMMFKRIEIICARVAAADCVPGAENDMTVFPGAPPGCALYDERIGFKALNELDVALLRADVPENVQRAIALFVDGALATDSFHRVSSHWNGLEALAPLQKGPWHCQECDQDVPECPSCNHPTAGPATVRSIREYLVTNLEVSKADFKELYRLRCQIAHGGLAADHDGIEAAARKANRIEYLLLAAIKLELGWPADKSPIVLNAGDVAIGPVVMKCRGILEWDEPPVVGHPFRI